LLLVATPACLRNWHPRPYDSPPITFSLNFSVMAKQPAHFHQSPLTSACLAPLFIHSTKISLRDLIIEQPNFSRRICLPLYPDGISYPSYLFFNTAIPGWFPPPLLPPDRQEDITAFLFLSFFPCSPFRASFPRSRKTGSLTLDDFPS